MQGLRLAISRSIIEVHGSRLWAESNQGAGATFSFRLNAGRSWCSTMAELSTRVRAAEEAKREIGLQQRNLK